MERKQLNWIKVAESAEEIIFGANHISEITAGEKSLCIANHNGKLFAFASTCPHAGGNFVHGFIDASGNVVCPMHRYKFNLRNGHNTSGEGYYLKHWPVEVRVDGVYVGLGKGLLASLL